MDSPPWTTAKQDEASEESPKNVLIEPGTETGEQKVIRPKPSLQTVAQKYGDFHVDAPSDARSPRGHVSQRARLVKKISSFGGIFPRLNKKSPASPSANNSKMEGVEQLGDGE